MRIFFSPKMPALISNFFLFLVFFSITINCYILREYHFSKKIITKDILNEKNPASRHGSEESQSEPFDPVGWSAKDSVGQGVLKRTPEMSARGFKGDSFTGRSVDLLTSVGVLCLIIKCVILPIFMMPKFSGKTQV